MKKNTLALIALCGAVFSMSAIAIAPPSTSQLTLNLDSADIDGTYSKFYSLEEMVGKGSVEVAQGVGGHTPDGKLILGIYAVGVPNEADSSRKPQLTTFDYSNSDPAAGSGVIGLGGAVAFVGDASMGDFSLFPNSADDNWTLQTNMGGYQVVGYILTDVVVTPGGTSDFTLTGNIKYGAVATALFGGPATDVIGTFKFETTPPITVPNVVGKTQAVATADIKALGLSVDVTEEFDLTVPSGDVISQFPLAGYESDSITPLSEVNLVVSKGPAPVNTPNVVNQTEAAAIAAFNSAGFTATPTVTPQAHPTIAVGLVISQTPAASASVAPSTAVTLAVSTGPGPVNVPSVVGKTEAIATTMLEDAGLTVTKAAAPTKFADGAPIPADYQKHYSDTVPSGSVISQTVVAGTEVAHGSAVEITVSAGSAATAPITVSVANVKIIDAFIGGNKVADATSALHAAGFNVVVEKKNDPAIPAGEIIDINLGTTASQGGAARALADNGTAPAQSDAIILVSLGAAAAGAVTPIPTLSFWGLLALSALMPGMVSFMSRRKSRK